MKKKEEIKAIENAGIYVRVSTQTQGKDGNGIDVQKKKCHMFAEMHGYKIVEIYEDVGVSGKLEISDRPGFSKCFEDLKAGKFQVLIVSSLDRLARIAELMLRTIRQISEIEGCYLVSVKENIDTTTPHGEFFLTILSGMSQYERTIIANRMYTGREHRRNEVDGDIGGRLPYGYVRINKIASLDVNTAPVVNRIYRLYLGEEKTMAEISRIFNAEKIPTPKKNEWTEGFLNLILRAHRDKYMGGYRCGSKKGRWPRILDPDVVRLVKLDCRDDLLPSFAPQNLPPKQRKYYRDPVLPSGDE